MSHLFDSTDPRPIHFLGIGGAGMSALALAALRRGIRVSGCDPVDIAFADLRRAGAEVFHQSEISHLEGIRALVVTAAIPDSHPELLAARRMGLEIIPRKAALAQLVNSGTVVGLAGTHGKTTTTVMTTVALQAAGLNPNGLAGGRVASWGGNALLAGEDLWVVEADEYDKAFLTLEPTIAVINNVEVDHMECYGSVAALDEAFTGFANRATVALVGTADEGSDRIAKGLTTAAIRFGFEPGADLCIAEPQLTSAGSTTTLTWADGAAVSLKLAVPGRHNLRNAAAALGVVYSLGGDINSAAEALATFEGVGRRFERLGIHSEILFVDDYAHHPTELAVTLNAAKQAYPERRLVAVFQPHLFSRTLEHGAAMGIAIASADVAIVTDVYPAREKPISGVTGELVAEAARAAGAKDVRYLPDRAGLTAMIERLIEPGDLVITIGAGDITKVGPELISRLTA